MALSERMRQEQAQRARQPRMLTNEELADCCGGCSTNSAIETWMQRAIAKFCEVNGIRLAAGVQANVPQPFGASDDATDTNPPRDTAGCCNRTVARRCDGCPHGASDDAGKESERG